jgi:ribonuclease HI
MQSVQPNYYLLTEACVSTEAAAAPQWHFVLEARDGSCRLDVADAESDMPLDRIELLALVRGLEALDHPAKITLFTPSRYVSHGLRFGLDQWRENGWQWESFGQMTAIKNEDLWRRVDLALTIHNVECKALRNDIAHEPVTPAPHTAPEPARRTRTTVRKRRSRQQAQESVPTGLMSGLRSGVSGWLQGLGRAIAPSIGT